jgi:transposase InsO family protein
MVVERLRDQYPVTLICEVLDVSPSGYYAWRTRPESARSRVDRHIKNEIRSVFEKSRETYGSPRIHDELQDRGIRCGRYQKRLKKKGLIVSMSRKGDCWDNAVAESFFATLKIELGNTFSSRKAARLAFIDYIEIFYNRQRRHTSLGGLTPAQAEAQFEMEVAA